MSNCVDQNGYEYRYYLNNDETQREGMQTLTG